MAGRAGPRRRRSTRRSTASSCSSAASCRGRPASRSRTGPPLRRGSGTRFAGDRWPDHPEESPMPSDADLALIDAYWRAANYLSVGQIYLLDNPLLREPLRPEHVKPRLLGHWGTTPGLNLLYAHMNRVIRQRDLNALYVTGPGPRRARARRQRLPRGHLQRGVLRASARTWTGMRALFRQFSFPGGIPSHVAPETPGSIHEGGELGYALVHAYGAVFDNPRPAGAVRGRRRRGRDRPAGRELALEQVPRPRAATARCCRSCTSTATRSPTRPCWPASPTTSWRRCCAATATRRTSSRATSPGACTSSSPPPSTGCSTTSPRSRRDPGDHARPAWPMIVLRTPEGLDRAEGGRRPAGRGHLPRPPGAAAGHPHRRRAPRAARGVDAQLPARGAVRRRPAGWCPSCARSPRPGRAG